MTLHRSTLAALCACGVFAAPAAAHSTATPSRAALELSSAGKRALAARSITVTSVPRGPSKSPSFAVGGWTIGSSAKIGLTGSLRFRSGKRTVSASRLQVTVSRTSSYLNARIGKSSVRLFTVTPTKPAVLDAAGQRVSLAGARVALTRAAASRLRSSLKLKRAPSTATLGKLTVAVARELATPPAATVPAPAPAPVALPAPVIPAATATPEPTATAEPTLPGANPCGYGPTPAGSIDWFGCDLPGSADLKSWTNYVQSAFPQFPCQGPLGTIVPGGGATEVVEGDKYDHRFPVLSSDVRPDGSATIVTGGDVTYTMPVHGIDEAIGAFRLEIAAGGKSGTVYADGRAKPFDTGGDVCGAVAQPYSDVAVLTLDLTTVTPVTADGVTSWVHVPAKVAPGTDAKIGGGQYPAGSAWGSFTIALPASGAVG